MMLFIGPTFTFSGSAHPLRSTQCRLHNTCCTLQRFTLQCPMKCPSWQLIHWQCSVRCHCGLHDRPQSWLLIPAEKRNWSGGVLNNHQHTEVREAWNEVTLLLISRSGCHHLRWCSITRNRIIESSSNSYRIRIYLEDFLYNICLCVLYTRI